MSDDGRRGLGSLLTIAGFIVVVGFDVRPGSVIPPVATEIASLPGPVARAVLDDRIPKLQAACAKWEDGCSKSYLAILERACHEEDYGEHNWATLAGHTAQQFSVPSNGLHAWFMWQVPKTPVEAVIKKFLPRIDAGKDAVELGVALGREAPTSLFPSAATCASERAVARGEPPLPRERLPGSPPTVSDLLVSADELTAFRLGRGNLISQALALRAPPPAPTIKFTQMDLLGALQATLELEREMAKWPTPFGTPARVIATAPPSPAFPASQPTIRKPAP